MWIDEVYDLKEKYILARYLYGISQPTIDDKKYSNLHKMMLANGYLPEYTGRSWSSDPVPLDLLKKYNKEYLARKIELTDKTESIPSLGTEQELWEEIGMNFEPGYLSEKKDGWNLQHSYDDIGDYYMTNTRGRSCDPILKNHLIANMDIRDKIDTDKEVTVVGEGTVPNAQFEELKRRHLELNLTLQRAAVSTILANPEDTDLLRFSAFQIKGIDDAELTIKLLKSWGFRTPHFRKINTYEELLQAIKDYGEDPEILSDSTDGLVFWKLHGGYRRAIRLGRWEEKVAYSYIEGYMEQWNTTLISPSLIIRPVKIKGATRKSVNITNWSRIVHNDLRIGSPIAFIIKSDATADIDEAETHRLQEKYKGAYMTYRARIDAGQRV